MKSENKYLIKIFILTFILVYGGIWLYRPSNTHPLNQDSTKSTFIYQQF